MSSFIPTVFTKYPRDQKRVSDITYVRARVGYSNSLPARI